MNVSSGSVVAHPDDRTGPFFRGVGWPRSTSDGGRLRHPWWRLAPVRSHPVAYIRGCVLILWYDKDGLPISIDQASVLLSDMTYKRVRRTKITSASDPNESFDVSTVWLGLDHNWSDGPPLIFETMVFGEGCDLDLECWRYSTLAAAEEGHAEVVTVVAATLDDAIVMDAEDTVYSDRAADDT